MFATMSSWSLMFATLLSLTVFTTAYRPVQHCKQLGDNGHYSACTSLAQHYNASTSTSDLYVRYHWYKYKDSALGWHSFGLGARMAGALMFVFYGDPTVSTPHMTISVRSAEGHHEPQIIERMDAYNVPAARGRIPGVDVITSTFEPYSGPYTHPQLDLKPSHIGIAEFIVRNYGTWIGAELTNTSTKQPMIWSSRYDQEYDGDYSVARHIDMHMFGLGFGFIYADLLNAETPIPMFGPIVETEGHKGINELRDPLPPTDAELAEGERLIRDVMSDPVNAKLQVAPPAGSSDESHNPFDDHNTTPSTVPEDDPNTNPVADHNDEHEADHDHDHNEDPADHIHAADGTVIPIETTTRRLTVRNWMWHLHGFLMTLAFFVGYPLGVYLLRSPKQIAAGESFNYHWTVQALSTLVFALGCFVGYMQSRSISVTHQYVGIAIALAIGVQILLGWRHHIKFLEVRTKTWLSRTHIGLGRVIMPLAFVNVLSGMKLRGYGNFTMLLTLVAEVSLIIGAIVYLRRAAVRREKMGVAAVVQEMKAQGPSKLDEAEEYFQLGGEDDSEDENDVAARDKQDERRKQNERLSKLDRV